MKKGLLFLVLGLIMGVGAKAQTNWCPTDAQWHYYWMSMGDEGYVHYRYTKDTVYENLVCHKIESTRYQAQHVGPYPYYLYDTLPGGNYYTYSAYDTVYFYYSMFSKWLPVYYFNAQVGDTLVIPNYALHTNSDSTVNVLVDSTGIMQIDTSHLRYYCFHIIDSVNWCGFTGKAVEKLGMMDNDLIPFWHCVTDDYYYNFCSYQDSVITLYPAGAACLFITGISELTSATANFSLTPNPASNTLTITVDESLLNSTATITDITGRVMKNEKLEMRNTTLETANLAAGIYLVTITGPGGRSATKKLIINK